VKIARTFSRAFTDDLPLIVFLLLQIGSVSFAAAPTTTTTTTTTRTTTTATLFGPDVVLLRELVALYEPVPFAHASHARMAEMWDGCTTCHHRPPSTQPTTEAAVHLINARTQDASTKIPACKSCHAILPVDAASIRQPTLKAAYHRQCLNCHREWMHGNACVICHKPLDPRVTTMKTDETIASSSSPSPATLPVADDIIGRMHPPIAPPDVATYRARVTPADGKNVLFRHKEHVATFGLKCVSCHHRDNCANCHDSTSSATATTNHKPVHPGKTWRDSHEPCSSCHEQDRCTHCHFDDAKPAPAAFDHRLTGQALDKDHASLGCVTCHEDLRTPTQLTCGDASCHKDPSTIAYPTKRPGELIALKVTTTRATSRPATTQSAGPRLVETKATNLRIRRDATR
jgi:hypothetical protein